MNTLSIYNLGSIPKIHPVYTLGMEKLPNKIRHYRLKLSMSQQSLGNSIGKKKDTISKWERGERKLKLEEAIKVSHVLGITIGDIAGEIEGNLYEADEELMKLSAEAIQGAATSSGKKISLPEAMAYTVQLYNHVIDYRKKGENIFPNEAMAALILKSVA